MEGQIISVRQGDKTYTKVYVTYAKNNTAGSILLLHDMCEHHDRFREFTAHLNSIGYDVFSFDYRGHGAGIKFEELGHISNNLGWQLLLDDADNITQYIKKINRGSRTLIFGQGIGACIALNLVSEHKDIDACVCSGIPNMSDSKLRSLNFKTNFIKKVKGPTHYSKKLANKFMVFPDFMKISDRTTFDWMSRDNKAVGGYISDPLCGYTCTAAFYSDMLKIISVATSRKFAHRIRKEMPLLIISGSLDPVTNYGDYAVNLFEAYEHKLDNVDCIIYDECRHDLLHETNKASIMKDITDWLSKMLYASIPAASALALGEPTHQKESGAKPASTPKKKNEAKEKAMPPKEAPVLQVMDDNEADDNIKNLGYFEKKKK